MALRHLTTPPKAEDFTPLEEHQEQTPATFFGSKPVLHSKHTGLTLSGPKEVLQSDATFSHFKVEGDGQDDNALVNNAEVWVSSENLIIFQSSPSPTGVSIPYPSIALHATMKWRSQVEALFMNISLNDAETVNDDDDIQILELTVLPPKFDTNPETACIGELYDAMNTCADLHPDPNDSDVEDDFDETAPGATGWITADNMDDYVDEDGNFKGPVIGDTIVGEELGPGAGTVRPREEDNGPSNGVNGHNDDGETKWQRTG